MKYSIIPDIISLEPNLIGNDYILGDIHGYKNTLEKVIATLTPKDRLFIVGDLTDRGPHNVEVIEMLVKLKANPNGPKIYVTTGNHERLCLNTIVALESIFESIKKDQCVFEDHTLGDLVEKAAADDEDVDIHSMDGNGGKWLKQLFLDEISNKKIFIKDGKTYYTADSKIKLIETFLFPLPYIIRVKGDKNRMAFNVVHADMPISDTELLKRINIKKPFLSSEEKDYATWARESDFENKGQHSYSVLTYVGHNIVVFDNPSVRDNTNTINLDFGNYTSKVAFMVNHTNKTSVAILGEHQESEATAFIAIPDIESDQDEEMPILTSQLQKQIQSCWHIDNEETLQKFCEDALLAQAYILHQQYYQKTAAYIQGSFTADEIDTKIAELVEKTKVTYIQLLHLTINNDYVIDKILIKDLLDILQRRIEFTRTNKLRMFDMESLPSITDETSESIQFLKQLLNPRDTFHFEKAGACFTTHLK